MLRFRLPRLSVSDPDLRASRSLLAFTVRTKPDYAPNWHHAELARRLDRVAAGLCRRLMVFMPPQHGKSELVSRRFPAYMLGKKPDLRLIGRLVDGPAADLRLGAPVRLTFEDIGPDVAIPAFELATRP